MGGDYGVYYRTRLIHISVIKHLDKLISAVLAFCTAIIKLAAAGVINRLLGGVRPPHFNSLNRGKRIVEAINFYVYVIYTHEQPQKIFTVGKGAGGSGFE